MHKQLHLFRFSSLPALAVTVIIVSFFALAPAAEASPWWWAQFSKGDDVGVEANQLAKWIAFFISSASDTTNGGAGDTVYQTSFTWSAVNTGHAPVTGISNDGSIGLNAVYTRRAGVGDRNVRIIGDADEATWPPTGVNGSIGQSGESGIGTTHNKVTYVSSRGLITGSANVTDNGGYSAQPNDMVMLKAAAVPGVMTDYLDDLSCMFSGTFGEGSSNNTNYVFASPYSDTIEVYFTDDNGSIPVSLAKNADGTNGNDIGDVWTRLVLDADESVFYLFNQPQLVTAGGFGGNYTDALLAFTGVIAGAAESENQGNSMYTNLSGDHTCRDGSDFYSGASQMHNKLQIFDMDVVATGSANHTATATRFSSNEENIIVIHDPGLARRYMPEWHRVMARLNSNAGGGGDIYETTAPAAPTNLSANPTATTFPLSWTAPANPGDFSRYYVFVSDTVINSNKEIGNGADDDGDGYFDEDPYGDWDGFASGATAGTASAANDDADGSVDEDRWLYPELVIRRATPAGADSAVISSCNVHDSLAAGTNYWFAVVAVDKLGNESIADTAGPYQLATALDTTIEVSKNSDIASANVAKGSTNNVVLLLHVNGDTQYDYLKTFAIECIGTSDMLDIRNVRLWHDADNDSAITGADFTVDTLVYNAGTGWWHATALTGKPDTNITGDTGNNYLVSVDIYDTAAERDTVVFRVPASSCMGNRSGTGPASAITSNGVLTIPSIDNQIIINEFLPNPDMADHDGDNAVAETDEEFVELYNPGPSTVDLGSWKIRDNGSVGITLPASPLNLAPYQYLIAFAGADTTGNEFYIFDRAQQLSAGTHTGTWGSMNTTNDGCNILNDNGETIATYQYASTTGDSSFARMWDNSSIWLNATRMTRGTFSGILGDSKPHFVRNSPNAHLSLSANPATITAGDTTLLTITARRPDYVTCTYLAVPIDISVSSGSVNPTVTASLSAGVCSTTLTLSGATGNIVITAAYATTTYGTTTVIVNSGVPSTNLAVTTAGNVADTSVYPGGTNIPVLAIKITGDTDGDTLTQFAVRNLGRADSADVTVRLWKDNNGDSKVNAGDTLVATLISGGGDTWYRNGIPVADSSTLAATGSYFLVTIDVSGTATIGDTFQAQVAAYSCDAFYFDSGPTTAATNTGKATIALPPANNITVDTRGTVPSANVARGDSSVVAITLKITGSPAGDTLIRFAVRNLGSAVAGTDIGAVKLWKDNGDSTVGTGDTLVAVLANSGDTWYAAAIPPADSSALAAAGSAFIVTIDITAGATNGATFRAAIPAIACDAATFDSGPAAAIGNPGTLTINVPDTSIGYDTQIVINEILPGPGAASLDHDGDFVYDDAEEEFVELYNNADAGVVNIGGWKLSDAVTLNDVVLDTPILLGPRQYLICYRGPDSAGNYWYRYASDGSTLLGSGPYGSGTFPALSADTVYLGNSASVLIDSKYNGNAAVDKSTARVIDGWDSWVASGTPTPGRNLDPTPAYNRPSANALVVVSASPSSINSGGTTSITCTVKNSDAVAIAEFNLDAAIAAAGCTSITPAAMGAFIAGVKTTTCTINANPGQVVVTVAYNTTTFGTTTVTINDPGNTVPPDDITGLSVVPGYQKVTVIWTATTAADSSQYRIYYDTRPITNVTDASVTLAGTLACNLGDTDYLITGLASDTVYYFAVTATDLAGNEDTYPAVNVSCTPTAAVILAALSDTAYFAGIYTGDTGIELLAISCTNTMGLADTITSLTLNNTSPYRIDTAVSVAALKVWRDNGMIGILDGADVLQCILDTTASGWSGSCSIPMPAGSVNLLFTLDATANPRMGDSIMLQLPANGMTSANAETGPTTAVGNPCFQFVSRHSILLSEIESDIPGSEGQGDYIELYNPGNSAVSLNGWKLTYSGATTNPFTATAALATFGDSIIPAFGYYLVGADSLPVVHGISYDLYNNMGLGGTAGHVTLRDSANVIIDVVGYGTGKYSEGDSPAESPGANTSEVIQRKANSAATAATMAGSDWLAGNGWDSDNNGFDWVITTAEPQNSSSETEPRPATGLTVDTARTAPALTAPRGSANVLVAALRVTSSLGSDTLTAFTVHNLGTADGITDLAAVKLWRDVNGDSQLDAGDLLVVTLTNSGDTWYTLNADTALAGGGTYFLVTADFAAGAYGGRTFQAQVPARGCDAFSADSGPLASVTNSASQSVTLGVRLSEILADPPTGVDINGDSSADPNTDEFIELLNDSSAPADLASARLRQNDGSYAIFPAGTILAAGARLICFPSDDADTDYYLFPGTAHAGAISAFDLGNASDTIALLSAGGDTIDLYGWSGIGDINQSFVWTAAGWQQHEAADTADASSYSPGTSLIATNGSISTDIPAGFAEKGDTGTVLLACRLYGDRDGDMLVNFRVANVGTAINSDLKNVRLVRDWDSDAAFDTPVGDSVVAALTWYAADTSWRAYGLSHALADTLNARFLVVADIDSPGATVGRTIQLRLAPYGSRTAAADSGPMNPAGSNAYVLTIKEPSPIITAITDDTAYYAAIYANSTGIPALAISVANAWGQADTITSLTVQAASPYDLDSQSVGAVRAWVNAGDTSRLDSSDSLVTTLSPYIPGQWRITGLNLALPAAGLHLLFTLEATANPVMGDSIMLQVPANGIIAAVADTGPMAAVTNNRFQFVSQHSLLLSEIEVDAAGSEGIGGEYIELYNPTSTPVSLNGWRLQDVTNTSNPYSSPTYTAIAVLGQYDSVPAHGFYMLGTETSGITPDYYSDTFDFASTGGHVVLRNDSFVIIDLFAWGNATAAEGDSRAAVMTTNNSQVYERKAFDTSTTATMAGSDLLAGNRHDSDCNNADWVVSVATPQNAFSETEPRPWQRVAIDTMRVAPDTTVPAGAARVLALAVRITGSPAGDTLTAFTVHNLGTALATTDISAAQLWRDVNADSQWNAGDLLVTALANASDTWYTINADTSLAGAGSSFLVTVDIAGGAVSGRTFQAQVPALRSDAQLYSDGGPADTVTNTGVVTIGSVVVPAPHLLISEVMYDSTREFFEIWNPTDTPVTLTNYYVSDNPLKYYKIVNNTQDSASGDFIARFPAGTILAAHDTLVICLNSTNFNVQYPGVFPDFEIYQDGAGDGVSDMLDSGIGGSLALTDGSEPLILFTWDNDSDLVDDVDIVVWGAVTDKYEFPNKTGISIDGIDADAIATAYAVDDTAVASVADDGANGQSIIHSGYAETGEITLGGNGILGHDETSESMALTWTLASPSPWHNMLIAYRVVDLPFAYARQGDTLVEVLSFFVGGARGLADNLTRVTLVNSGTLSDTGVKRVWLYHDANGDGAIDGGDNAIGTLAWTGTAWETAAMSAALPAGGDTFILAIDIGDSATNYDTFVGRINAYGLAAAAADSGSFTAIANTNAITIAALAAVQCYVPDVLATPALHATDTSAVVAVIYLSTNLGWADTLAALTLRPAGSMNDSGVARLSLWEDNGDSLSGAGDTFVANFVWNGTRWDTSGLAWPVAAAGTKFIVTLQADNRASAGDTLQLLVPAGGCTFATAFAGPAAADTVGYPLLLVETSPLVFSEVFYDPALPRQEFIELTVLQALDPSGWRIKDYDLGASSVDYTIPDTCPALQPGDLLVLRMDTGVDDLDRADGDVVFFLRQNSALSGTGDPLTLRDTDSQFRDFLAIEAGSDDSDLPALAPYVYCGWPNNRTAPAPGATAALGQSLFLNGTDLDSSSNWATSDTPTEGRSTLALTGELPAANVYAGDTRAGLSFTISDGSYADTMARLDRLRITNLGSLTAAELYAINLYADNGDSAYNAGDSLVAALAWDGSGWGAAGIGLTGINSRSFIIAISLRDTATHGGTFRANIPAYGVGTAYADSGPLVALSNAASLTARTQFIVAVDTTVTVPAASVAPGAANALAMALRITGHELGDTLTVFAVTNLGDGGTDTAFTAVRLWRDENANGSRDALDTLVATLTRSGETWAATIAAADSAVLAGSGTAFILTVDVDGTANLGETFQARIALSTVDAARADSGPLAALTGNTLTVSIATYAITGTAPLQGSLLDSGTILYLYSGSTLVDSATITSDSGAFSISAPNGGPYTLYVVGPRHLAIRVDGIVISGAGDTLGMLPEAPVGDIIRDNIINILDAAYLRGHFNTGDPRANLDGLGLVDAADMAYIRQNFGRRGASRP